MNKGEQNHLLDNIRTHDRESVSINILYDQYIKLGKTQYLLWLINFATFAVEFGEVALLSVLIPILRCEWHLSVYFEAGITVMIYVSYFITVLFFGKVADIYGRRKIMIFGSFIRAIGGTLSAIAPNKWVFLCCRVVVGLGIGMGGVIPVLALEFTPNKYRIPCIMSGTLGVYSGKSIVAIAGYFLVEPLGWRWFTAATALPCFVVAILTFLIPESPRYLIVSGQEDKAMEAIQQTAKWNKVTLPANLKVHVYDSETLGRFREIFSRHRRDVVSLCLLISGNLTVVYGFVTYLPLALTSNICGVNTVNGGTVQYECTGVTSSSLRNLSLATVSGLVGTIVAAVLSSFYGRLNPLRVVIFLQLGLVSLLYICIGHTYVVLSAVVFVTGYVNCIEWLIVAETFPTKIRATTCGFISSCGKVGGIIGSTSTYLLLYKSLPSLITLFLAASIWCFVGSILLNKETKNTLLADVDEEKY